MCWSNYNLRPKIVILQIFNLCYFSMCYPTNYKNEDSWVFELLFRFICSPVSSVEFSLGFLCLFVRFWGISKVSKFSLIYGPIIDILQNFDDFWIIPCLFILWLIYNSFCLCIFSLRHNWNSSLSSFILISLDFNEIDDWPSSTSLLHSLNNLILILLIKVKTSTKYQHKSCIIPRLRLFGHRLHIFERLLIRNLLPLNRDPRYDFLLNSYDLLNWVVFKLLNNLLHKL